MGTTTTTYALNKPTVGGDEDAWGTDWNTNADKLDDLFDGTIAVKPNLDAGLWKVGGVAVTSTAAELNILDGVTASTAELNILDGVTATAAELNVLDGIPGTLTATEIGYLDGVTSAIQTQLDAKQATITTLALANGGTGAALVDPNADRLMFWDDSAGATAYLEPGGGMVISGTTIDVSGTVAAQNVSSGTAVDFTVPGTATRIIIQFDAVSLSGTDDILVQLGDSGGVETTGYVSTSYASSSAATSTAGLILFVGSATRLATGEMSLSRVGSSSRWIETHACAIATGLAAYGGGSKTLSDTITTIRITRSGTDSFDGSGIVSIRYFL